jgi:hypothetical protein
MPDSISPHGDTLMSDLVRGFSQERPEPGTTGGHVGSFALTEAQVGPDASNLNTGAVCRLREGTSDAQTLIPQRMP